MTPAELAAEWEVTFIRSGGEVEISVMLGASLHNKAVIWASSNGIRVRKNASIQWCHALAANGCKESTRRRRKKNSVGPWGEPLYGDPVPAW